MRVWTFCRDFIQSQIMPNRCQSIKDVGTFGFAPLPIICIITEERTNLQLQLTMDELTQDIPYSFLLSVSNNQVKMKITFLDILWTSIEIGSKYQLDEATGLYLYPYTSFKLNFKTFYCSNDYSELDNSSLHLNWYLESFYPYLYDFFNHKGRDIIHLLGMTAMRMQLTIYSKNSKITMRIGETRLIESKTIRFGIKEVNVEQLIDVDYLNVEKDILMVYIDNKDYSLGSLEKGKYSIQDIQGLTCTLAFYDFNINTLNDVLELRDKYRMLLLKNLFFNHNVHT